MITVFHGGVQEIKTPSVKAGRQNLDFGQGFYLTRIQRQAEAWAFRASQRLLSPPVINQYQLDIEAVAADYRLLRFEHYDSEWLHFIVSCRKGHDTAAEYDCVEGGVANVRVVDTIEGFMNGTIDEQHALAELSKHQSNNQICILNQEIAERCLTFVKAL